MVTIIHFLKPKTDILRRSEEYILKSWGSLDHLIEAIREAKEYSKPVNHLTIVIRLSWLKFPRFIIIFPPKTKTKIKSNPKQSKGPIY